MEGRVNRGDDRAHDGDINLRRNFLRQRRRPLFRILVIEGRGRVRGADRRKGNGVGSRMER